MDNDCNCMCSEHWPTQFHKAIASWHKKIDTTTVVVGNFNTSFSQIDKPDKKDNKETSSLSCTIDQMINQVSIECFIKIKSTHSFQKSMDLSKIDSVLGHKASQ